MSGTEPVPGDVLTVRIGKPVHGGHALARHDGRILFVRHAAPGELARVRLRATGKTWRADAIDILEPSPDRVPVTWAEAGPGGVGAELAHLSLGAQREWKREVLRDALTRIGALDLPVTVVPLPGDQGAGAGGGWGTRTRIELTTDARGRAGMFAHRSRRLTALTRMPLAVPEIAALGLFDRTWAPGVRLSAVAPSASAPLILVDGRPIGGAPAAITERVTVGGRTFTYGLDATGFWQIHRRAPETLAAAVMELVGDIDGATVFDLFSGAGLFSLPLADAAGTGRVHAVEGDPRAHAAARSNAARLGAGVRLHAHRGDVATVLGQPGVLPARADVIVLDPPRAGAKAAVMEAIIARSPERIVYVACDPAALARDLATAATHGYRAERVDGYDMFPHTHHVEAIVVLRRE